MYTNLLGKTTGLALNGRCRLPVFREERNLLHQPTWLLEAGLKLRRCAVLRFMHLHWHASVCSLHHIGL